MKHSDFRVGREFMTATGRWRCTDVGKRMIAAIRLDHDGDPRWYNGPPYAVAEHVFDEDGIEACEPAPRRRSFDNSGIIEVMNAKTGKITRRHAGWRKRASSRRTTAKRKTPRSRQHPAHQVCAQPARRAYPPVA